MARIFATSIDLSFNQMLNMVLQNLPSDPAGEVAGQMYWNTSINQPKIFTGSVWVALSTSSVADATTTSKGIVQLAGDLAGTAASPQLAGFGPGAGTYGPYLQLTLDSKGRIQSVTPMSLPDATSAQKGIVQLAGDLTGSASNPQLSNSGVTPGSYTFANVQVDAKGRVTSASSGTLPDASTSQKGLVQLAGDLGGTATAPTVQTVGGASAANLADAVTKRHIQGTDTGTTSPTFKIDSANNNAVTLKNNGGVLEARNALDTAYVDLHVRNLLVEGNVDEVNVTSLNVGDSTVLLNSQIADNTGNSNATLEVKRFKSDGVTRDDAVAQWNESSQRWQLSYGAGSALATAIACVKQVYSIGDGVATSFIFNHNLNTRDLSVTVRETSGSFNEIACDVQFTTLNAITLLFSVAPTSGQYSVTIQG